MNFKTYAFRLAIALTAFVFGVLSFNALPTSKDAAQKKNPELIASPAVPQIEVFPPSVASLPNIQTMPVTEINRNPEYEFDASGDYYVFSDSTDSNYLPKAFQDFSDITIITTDYTKASEKNDYTGIPIPPEGALWTNSKYTLSKHTFSRINIADRQIAFETETKKGISYKFVGKFPEYNENDAESFADLEGTLTKMRNGRKIAEMKIRLVAVGC